MTDLYQFTVSLFYQLANAFFWPVAAALLLLLAITCIDLGRVLFTFWRRRRQPHTDLPVIAQALAQCVTLQGALDDVALSPSLRRFWSKVEARLKVTGSDENVDLWLEEVLQQEEIHVAEQLDRGRLFVRIGPMLGLCGTIIPLGPALHSLLGGDMVGMVNHLVVGFGAVVCGLVTSGVSYFITLLRERWTRTELKEMENLCELVLRALRSNKQTIYEDTDESFQKA
jgi:biopolymer transport protein ExbB/TolQ